MTFFDQQEYEVRCEWGGAGLAELLPDSDAVVIVDVLSFSTCVDIAAGNGAAVYPYPSGDEAAAAYADSLGALLASPYRTVVEGFSLSPASLTRIPAGTRLVLPSPNGATLTLATGDVPAFAGCLRNAGAVAGAAARIGPRISVIPVGERWHDGSLRPSLEDLLGAGAIIHHLPGSRSPEAESAVYAFLRFRENLANCLRRCGSGKELFGRGFSEDVALAAMLNVSDCAPVLAGGAYRRALL
jgi:2-phosphosulfolactate phosphatase